MHTRQWRMRHRTPVLAPEDFLLTDAHLPDLATGQVMARVLMASLDPYLAHSMQTWTGETPAWSSGTIHGHVLARVERSETDRLRPGDLITGLGRWQDYEVFDADRVRRVDDTLQPASLALGALSASGWTAWIGLRLADIEAGQTIFISAATGTVGSIAGQLARQRGARVIGMVGGEHKRRHALEVLGFHACVDHTAPDLTHQVAAVAEDGIDVVFENVGTPSIDAALPSMVHHGTIILCGAAAHYNADAPATLRNFTTLLYKQISILPLAVSENRHLLEQARRELREAVSAGELTCDETISDGLENAATAYLSMLTGTGVGKRLLRISH